MSDVSATQTSSPSACRPAGKLPVGLPCAAAYSSLPCAAAPTRTHTSTGSPMSASLVPNLISA